MGVMVQGTLEGSSHRAVENAGEEGKGMTAAHTNGSLVSTYSASLSPITDTDEDNLPSFHINRLRRLPIRAVVDRYGVLSEQISLLVGGNRDYTLVQFEKKQGFLESLSEGSQDLHDFEGAAGVAEMSAHLPSQSHNFLDPLTVVSMESNGCGKEIQAEVPLYRAFGNKLLAAGKAKWKGPTVGSEGERMADIVGHWEKAEITSSTSTSGGVVLPQHDSPAMEEKHDKSEKYESPSQLFPSSGDLEGVQEGVIIKQESSQGKLEESEKCKGPTRQGLYLKEESCQRSVKDVQPQHIISATGDNSQNVDVDSTPLQQVSCALEHISKRTPSSVVEEWIPVLDIADRNTGVQHCKQLGKIAAHHADQAITPSENMRVSLENLQGVTPQVTYRKEIVEPEVLREGEKPMPPPKGLPDSSLENGVEMEGSEGKVDVVVLKGTQVATPSAQAAEGELKEAPCGRRLNLSLWEVADVPTTPEIFVEVGTREPFLADAESTVKESSTGGSKLLAIDVLGQSSPTSDLSLPEGCDTVCTESIVEDPPCSRNSPSSHGKARNGSLGDSPGSWGKSHPGSIGDSPKSRERFQSDMDAYADLAPIPFSGPIVYSGPISGPYSGSTSYSGAVNHSGQIPFSGSISHRSDSSAASNRSFAFPIMANEWNSSPVRMAQPDRRFVRCKRRWRPSCLCCSRPSTYY